MSSTDLSALNLSEHQLKGVLSIVDTLANPQQEATSFQTTNTHETTKRFTCTADSTCAASGKNRKFTPSELLQKKKRNTKSTAAQELFLIGISRIISSSFSDKSEVSDWRYLTSIHRIKDAVIDFCGHQRRLEFLSSNQ